ncbi:MAG: hypothetical protein ACLP1X_22865 [Polyangiaceae bacterium]
MASSPTCSSCGRRSLRYRKRTDDFVCRKCSAVLLAADVRAGELVEVQLRRLRPASRLVAPRRRPRADTARNREVARALAEMEAACKQLDTTVDRISRQHDPLGCLPFVLSLATGIVVAGIAARSVRWYLVVCVSLGGAAVTWLVLMVFRVTSWSRNHPLLAQMYKLQHGRADEDADFDRVELGEAIVDHYLPKEQSEPLLDRLEDAKERTAKLLGLDNAEPSLPVHHRAARSLGPDSCAPLPPAKASRLAARRALPGR